MVGFFNLNYMTQNAYHLLGSQAHWQVNKELARQTSIDAAILMADLISKRQWFIENKDIQDGWFFNTSENIELDTTLTQHLQRAALKLLETKGFIEIKYSGLPRKRYFNIVDDLLLKILTTGHQKFQRQEVKNFDINNNKVITINNNNKEKGNVSFSTSSNSGGLVFSIDELKTELTNAASWRESLARIFKNGGVHLENVDSLIHKFLDTEEARGTEVMHIKEAQRYCHNWMKIEIENNKKKRKFA